MSSKTTQSIHAVVGSDEGEVRRVALDLSRRLTPPEAGEFGLEIIDGQVDNVDAARERLGQTMEALLTVPFFGGAKLVWLKNATFLGDTPAGRSETVADAAAALADLLKNGLPPDIIFLISAPDIDKRRAFYKVLGKVAEMQVFDRIDTSRGNWEEQIESHIVAAGRERGLRFERDALELFVQLSGADLRQIGMEMEKIDLYLGPARRQVDVATIRKLVAQTRAGIVFELGNALARREVNTCLTLVSQLLRQGDSPIGILLVAIIPTVRNLLVAKDLMQQHRLRPPEQPFFFGKTLDRLPAGATRHLPRKKDGTINAFALGIAAQSAARHQLKELEAALHACVEASQQMVTTQLDPSLILSRLIVSIAAPGARR